MEILKKTCGMLFTVPGKPIMFRNTNGKCGRVLRGVTTALGIAAALLCPLYSYLMLEYLHFSNKARLFHFFETNSAAVMFGIGLFYLLFFCFACLIKKAWGATLIMTLLSASVGLVDHYKYSATGDYFYPWDIVQTKNVGELAGFVNLRVSAAFVILIITSFAFAFVTFLANTELPLKVYVRLPIVLLVIILMYLPVSTPQKVTDYLNKNGMHLEDMALQQSNYVANGFTGAFVVNILSGNIAKPENYSENSINEVLAHCSADAAKDEFCSPDIIVILSESFWNPNLLGDTVYSSNPLENYERICSQKGAISGWMVENTFGGGTVRPEFEVLTGLTTDCLPGGSVPWQYITKDTESYVSLYKNLGYDTLALHPYNSSFYNRKNGYPLIGFDNLYFEEELRKIDEVECETVSGSGYVSDRSFEKYLEYFLDNETEAPRFILGISMENHQSYLDKFDSHDITVKGNFDETTQNMVTNYVQGIKDADSALNSLVNYIDGRDRPTVLVYFGDHLPSLGADFAAYVESGMISAKDNITVDERQVIQSTPFLVYSNYTLPYESGLLHEGDDNRIASYNLMNGVSELVGAPRTRLMNFLSEYAKAIPCYNIRLYITLDETQKEFVLSHRLLTYDRIAGKCYSID